MSRTPPRRDAPVDREKTCPFLLRLFCQTGTFHREEFFYDVTAKVGRDEFQVYTWTDATLSEIAQLVKSVEPKARDPQAKIAINIVSAVRSGFIRVRPAGDIRNNRKSYSDNRTLSELGFIPGDMMDVAVFL